MSLRSLAFGPLPSAQVRASQRLDLPSPSGPNVSLEPTPPSDDAVGPSAATLSALGSGQQGGGFSPVFPDQFTGSSANGPAPTGTSVAALQGEGQEAGGSLGPDFLSDLSKALSGLRASGGPLQEGSALPPNWAQDLDTAFKSLKGANQTSRLLPSSKAPESGLPSGGTSLGDLGTHGFSLTGGESPGFDFSGFSLGGQSPDFAGLEGFSPGDLGSEAGSGLGGGLGGAVGGAIGGLGGLYSLYQGAQTGNPLQIITGLTSAYAGGSAVAGTVLGQSVAPISSLLASVAPEATAAALSAITGTTVAATSAGIASAMSAAAAAYSLPLAAVIFFVTQAIGTTEEMNARGAGWFNNPIKGALSSNATAGVGTVNKTLADLAAGGGIDKASTSDLMTALPALTNMLMPYYATGQGGLGAIRASDTFTGGHGGTGAKGLGGADQYTANFTQAQKGVTDIVNALLKRGVSYEDLGKLPVSGNWTQASLDLGGGTPPLTAGQRGEGEQLLARMGQPAGAISATPDELVQAAQGAAGAGPDSATHASGLLTSMYGGPLWTALARMNAGGPDLQTLIAQHYDPWATVRGFTPDQLYAALEPQVLRTKASQADTNAFTSGGG